MCSYLCAMSDPKAVLLAAIMTLAITIALTLYALTTKTDFTSKMGVLTVLLLAIIVMAIFMSLTTWSKTSYIIYATLCVIFYGIFLVFDVQMLVGHKRFKYSIDDYIVASLSIYIDIIMIFMYLLEILNLK